MTIPVQACCCDAPPQILGFAPSECCPSGLDKRNLIATLGGCYAGDIELVFSQTWIGYWLYSWDASAVYMSSTGLYLWMSFTCSALNPTVWTFNMNCNTTSSQPPLYGGAIGSFWPSPTNYVNCDPFEAYIYWATSTAAYRCCPPPTGTQTRVPVTIHQAAA